MAFDRKLAHQTILLGIHDQLKIEHESKSIGKELRNDERIDEFFAIFDDFKSFQSRLLSSFAIKQ